MAARKKAAPVVDADVTIAFKGLDGNFACRGHVYEVGTEYTHAGALSLCHSGFHACVEPLDTLTYYPIASGNRYGLVELRGVSDQREADSKRVAASIVVVKELTVRELIEAQVAYTAAHADKKSSGYASQSASSGDSSQSASSGDYSKSASSGNASQSASSGYASKSASSGDSSKSASSGYASKSASSGNASQSASSGDSSKSASSGNYSKSASSGDSSQSASSGNYSQSASSGNYSQSASSGDSSQSASSGNYSQSASSGNATWTECDTNGFACAAGVGGRVRGNAGSALSLGYVDARQRNRIAIGYVGEDGIEAGVWYVAEAKTGQLVAAL